jgi:hypothetical protein
MGYISIEKSLIGKFVLKLIMINVVKNTSKLFIKHSRLYLPFCPPIHVELPLPGPNLCLTVYT